MDDPILKKMKKSRSNWSVAFASGWHLVPLSNFLTPFSAEDTNHYVLLFSKSFQQVLALLSFSLGRKQVDR